MTKNEICKIVEKVFKLKNGSVNENTTSSEIEQWDSLGQFALIDYMDKNFNNITTKKNHIAMATSIKELYDFGLKDF